MNFFQLCDSEFLVGFRVRLDCQKVNQDDFWTSEEVVLFSCESKLANESNIPEVKFKILEGNCDSGSSFATTDKSQKEGLFVKKMNLYKEQPIQLYISPLSFLFFWWLCNKFVYNFSAITAAFILAID